MPAFLRTRVMAPYNAQAHPRLVPVCATPSRLPRQTTLWLVAFVGIVGYFLLRYIVLNPAKLFAIRAGLSSFGGFLGGTIAAVVFCKRRA